MDYQISERQVRRARLEFKDGVLRIIVPKGKQHLAPAMIKRYASWIEKRNAEFHRSSAEKESLELIDRREAELYDLIQGLIRTDGLLLQVKPRSIKFRMMKRRWGSCSRLGDIVLNRKLKYLPENLIRYVVFHELCHLRIHAHDKNFKILIRSQFENAKAHDRALKLFNQVIEKQL